MTLADALMATVLTGTCLTPILALLPDTQRRLSARLTLSTEARVAARILDEQMALDFSALTVGLGQPLTVDTGEAEQAAALDVEAWDIDGDGQDEADVLRLTVRVGSTTLTGLKVAQP